MAAEPTMESRESSGHWNHTPCWTVKVGRGSDTYFFRRYGCRHLEVKPAESPEPVFAVDNQRMTVTPAESETRGCGATCRCVQLLFFHCYVHASPDYDRVLYYRIKDAGVEFWFYLKSTIINSDKNKTL